MADRSLRAARLLRGGTLLSVVLLASLALPLSRGQGDRSVPSDGVRDTAARIWYPTRSGDAASADPVRSLINHRRPIRFGDHVWDARGVPPGPLWVRVDLARQTLSVFRGGHEIGATVILYGTDNKRTPIGTFPILQRARQHRSTLYDAEMPFMLRLTGDGVAIHASGVLKGRATHGCIGVPEAFARRLFDVARVGDRVTILPA